MSRGRVTGNWIGGPLIILSFEKRSSKLVLRLLLTWYFLCNNIHTLKKMQDLEKVLLSLAYLKMFHNKISHQTTRQIFCLISYDPSQSGQRASLLLKSE